MHGQKKTQKHPKILALLALGALLTLNGCGPAAIQLEPAPDATNPGCAYALVAMPQELAGLQQRETTAQATTAWGEPASVILKCGVEIQEPVADPCVSVNGVDWILKPDASNDQADQQEQAAAGTWQASTYGRSPAVQVTFDADRISSSTLLVELNSAVSQLEQVKKCSNVSESLGL